MPVGEPTTAALRPMFYSHAKLMGKGTMSDEDYQVYLDAEHQRHSKGIDARFNGLKSNIENLVAGGLMDESQHTWWTEFLEKQESTDWAGKAGEVSIV